MFNIFKNSGVLSEHQKATRRIILFTGMVLTLLALGVFGIYPSNAMGILKPLDAGIMMFALFTVVFCIINLFNGDKLPGEVEFSNVSYFNLLFTLGTGVGVMVYGFNEAAQLAQYPDVHNPIGLVLNHWTIIPWCIYAAFAIFDIYDEKYKLLPNWLRTVKMYLYGVVMMVGIGTSFALGVITISDSIRIIYGITIPSFALVILLGSLVTTSLLLGVHKGMQEFAKIAMIIMYAFILVLAILAPHDVLHSAMSGIKSLFGDFLYNNVYTGRAVQDEWTSFYWVWWISWASFTSPFIVTISKGRSIRSVVIYLIIFPVLLSTIYMVLGNSIGMNLLAHGTSIDMLPFKAISFSAVIPIMFVILMILFYVTSSDSQSYAMDCMISKGSKTPIVYRKILWVFLEVLFVTVLLLSGNGTIKTVQGLGFLSVPFMIIFGLINVYLIAKFHINKLRNKNNEKSN
jgi:choline-glycine betaine transporter